MDGWMDGWMDEWMDGYICAPLAPSKSKSGVYCLFVCCRFLRVFWGFLLFVLFILGCFLIFNF